MNADALARAVQLILAPVVMISSAAVLLNGLLTHYGEVNGRIRTMNHERFDVVHQLATRRDALDAERLAEIDKQLPVLLRRHRLVHDGILAGYYAVVLLVLSMFFVAVAALTDFAWPPAVVLCLLLIGTSTLLYGLLLTTLEIRLARKAIVYETERSMSLEPSDKLTEPGGHKPG